MLFQRLFCHLLVQARLWAGRGEGSGMAQGTLGGIPVHWGQRMGPKPPGTWPPSARGSVCAQEWRQGVWRVQRLDGEVGWDPALGP